MTAKSHVPRGAPTNATANVCGKKSTAWCTVAPWRFTLFDPLSCGSATVRSALPSGFRVKSDKTFVGGCIE